MTLETVQEKGRIWGLVAQYAWRQARSWLHGGVLFRMQPLTGMPQRLTIAPQDLRTADATNAAAIYGGRFLFSGHLIETHGYSPFEIPYAPRDWQRELHGFSWLRDLRAADSQIARQNARALVDDWIKHCGRRHAIGWQPSIAARRVMSWLSYSPFLLEDGDHAFYDRFLRSLVRQTKFLRATINDAPEGLEQLEIAIAITAASISMAGQGRSTRQAIHRLDQELKWQILPDGGHVSRNPKALIDILTDLLPVRQALVSQGLALPETMMQSVDRMMPMMRFFRHGDGAIVHFNGMGSTPNDLIATLMAYDDARGAAPSNAPHSGYQRLTGGDTVVVMDAGKPPKLELSRNAHAGCLSFEFSSGLNRLVVNCGVSSKSDEIWRQVSRSTAAHSTATIEDTSSCRFLTSKRFTNRLGSPVIAGPTTVTVERSDDDMGIRVTASHNGYVPAFRVVHERDLRLAGDGSVLDGIDTFHPQGSLDPEHGYAIRFHLHPQVRASLIRGGSAVLLVCADDEAWEFEAPGTELQLEESIYLSDIYGHRKTSQIVLSGKLQFNPSQAWQFRKTAVAKIRRRASSEFEDSELPLE